MRLLTPADVRALLDRHGMRASRALGQNFLADPNTARRIARLAEIEPGDAVVEVGPGIGSLTLALVEAGADVVAIERDRHVVPLLDEVLDEALDAEVARPHVVVADALTADYAEILGTAAGRFTMVSNLPYNVATPLVARFLDDVPQVGRMLVMVQKEVAERLVARPGERAAGHVSVKVAYHARASLVGVVPPTVFVPRPRVDSALVRFVRHAVPPVDADLAAMMELVRAGFGQRRKTLRRALQSVTGAATPALLEAAGVDPSARAEQLDLDAWARLT
ncbi:MAG TPA: 16S rRNA (adenine(1518)-N(6)/adenine(1519)-N(6))-dimethyltransferase RsmA, partial [Acidimicrobiia bacterium]|nr:16S rRNA (adenine(1518)-N(6)/adenine(1519)-N(6))-dimethyltransferase RsmA [Acidimicrobiia bacterium]